MSSWNSGHTKFTHPSVLQISKTMAAKPRSNFWRWQIAHRPQYAALRHGEDLAEFYGTMLGDGCIERFARTEKLMISFNRKEREHIEHVRRMIWRLFRKEPKLRVRNDQQCDDLYLYQKHIAQRLVFPIGEKLRHRLHIPLWIQRRQTFLRRCLKGLFETDGDWTTAPENYTSVIKFTNRSQSLLDDVFACLQRLGYHPQRRQYDVRLARHAEVERFANWIAFRRYGRRGP
jgi:hypothetical protein